MRQTTSIAAAIAGAALFWGVPAGAADLPMPIEPQVVIVPQVAVTQPDNLCFTGNPVEVYIAPGQPSNGVLPAGMEVEILDTPYSRSRDLWVRIKPPRFNQYYGWVYTRDLICQ
ncbi:SH3 domain-containing protein [Acuticoccus kandeliae]|uniref:SH3 domain-containing protein n=1 Tax=Acuticoccus kandeliae TaxID=2073160 RepID=UPI000D3ED8E8|nr:SH3 domain-containing protein [Acuticoccus kandeliae]